MIELIIYSWRFRRSWLFAAQARHRERFNRTVLGSYWLGLSSLLSVIVLGIVYGSVFNVPNFWKYIVYLGVGITIWNCLASAVTGGMNMFKIHRPDILNSNIRPIFYVFEEWSFQLISSFQSLLIVLIALSLIDHSIILNLVFVSIVPLINLMVLMFWLPLIVGLLATEFDDIAQVVPILLQVLFLSSPILYKKIELGQNAWIANYNILYTMLELARSSIIFGTLDFASAGSLFILNVLGLTLSLRCYLSRERKLPYVI